MKYMLMLGMLSWVGLGARAMDKGVSYTEQELKHIWAVGKYHTKIVRLPPCCAPRLRAGQYHMRFDPSSSRLVCAINNNDVCIAPLQEFASEYELIKKALVRPVNLKINRELFQSIIEKHSPRATCKGFDYTFYNGFRDCCSNGAIFAGWCPRIISEYNMFYTYQDCIGLYDTENGIPFQFISLPQKFAVNGRGIVFNKQGTKLAVLLTNNTVALITPHKRLVYAHAFEDVIIKCQQ